MHNLLTTALLFAYLVSIQTIVGRVISNKTEFGREIGVKNVVISDGYSVTKTDNKGEFNLQLSPKAKFIFMTTPTGYEQEGNFYYSLKKLTSSEVFFKLKKVDKQANRFIHIGDSEESVYKNWIDGLKNYTKNHKVDFILFNGDICYEKGMKFHASHITTNTMGARVVYSLGNHDLVAGDYGEQYYENLFGPVWYSFDVGGVHFVNLPVSYGDKTPSYTTDDIYSWLKKDLDAQSIGVPIVLINHHLYGLSDDFLLKGETQAIDLKDYNIKGYLYAHYHTNLHTRTQSGVTLFSSMSPNKGGIDHSPSSFRVVSFNHAGDLSSEIKYSNIDKSIVANGFTRHLNNNSDEVIDVVANIYDTGSDAKEAWLEIIGNDSKIKNVSMLQKSSWSWYRTIAKRSYRSVRVKIRFSDGSILYKPVNINTNVNWIASMGGNSFMTSPLIVNNLVLCATIDDDTLKKASIQAFDKKSGVLMWKYFTRNSIKNNLVESDGHVIACDVEGWIYALDTNTGKLIWSKKIREKTIHPVFTQSVAVGNGVIYAGQGASLTALKVNDGDIVWVNNSWKGGVSTISSPLFEQKSNVLLTGGYWLGRFAHNASDGKLLWEKKDEDSRICDNSPVTFNGKFYYCSPGYITEVEPLTGKELEKIKINYTVNSNSRPFVSEKYFIVGTTDKGVVAFDRNNKYKEIWNFKTNPALLYTAPYTKDFQMTVESGVCQQGDNVYFGANDGYIYCLEISTGQFRWRMNVGSPILSNLTIDNQTLYVSDFGGNILSINLIN